MQLVTYPHDILRQTLDPVEDFGPNLQKIGEEMMDLMVSLNGAGLAANQVGINRQIFVTKKALPHKIICNPSWAPARGSRKYMDLEGCLSFPDLFIPVLRHASIDVSYQALTGEIFNKKLNGFSARVFQHETGHLFGKLFIDDLSEEQVRLLKG